MADVALVTVESTSSADFAEGALTITKPTGVAEGDLLLLFLSCSSSDSFSTPAGWTVIYNTTTGWSGTTDVYIYRRVADSSDVSASDYTFDVDDTAGELSATMMRVSGFNTTTPVEGFTIASDTSTNTARSHTISSTPTTSGSLLIGVARYTGAFTTSTYSSTGSPSWTEVSDHTRSTVDTVAVAYAQYNSTTEITNFSYTTSSETVDSDGAIFVVRTAVDSTAENTLLTTTGSLPQSSGSADASADSTLLTTTTTLATQSGSADSLTSWTTVNKS